MLYLGDNGQTLVRKIFWANRAMMMGGGDWAKQFFLNIKNKNTITKKNDENNPN